MDLLKLFVSLLIIAAVIVMVAYSASMPNERTYTHAVVNDVTLPYYYDCDIGVLYNKHGVPMVGQDGLPIPCYEIELEQLEHKITPSPEGWEKIEKMEQYRNGNARG